MRPFFIHDEESVWIVRKGSADLFLTRTVNGEPAGARRHVMRLKQGQAYFGLNILSMDPDVGLLAALSPDGEVICVSRESISDPGLIEGWITAVSAAISTSIPPAIFLPVDTRGETSVPKDSRPVLARDGLVWVQHVQGKSRVMGLRELAPLNGGDVFPLVAPVWLEPEPFSRIKAVATATAIAQYPGWKSLEGFHRIAMTCLLLNWRRAEQEEAERLQRKSRNDAHTVAGSIQQLAAPLRQKRGAPAVLFGEDRDPLLLACRAIGEAAGISFKPHPDSRAGKAQKDPVANIARASGLRVRRVLLDGAWWTRDNGPLLAFRESDNRPMALLVSARRYEVYDPVEESRVRVDAARALELGAFAFVFYRPFPIKKLTATDLVRFGVRGSERDLAMIVLLGVASGILAMLTPVLTGILFDTVIPGAERTQLLQLTIFLVASAFSAGLFQLARGFSLLRLEGQADSSLQAAVWDRLLNLPAPFFREFSAGDLAARSLGIGQMRRVLTGSALTSILTGVFSIFSFLLLFYYSPRLAALATVLIVVACAVSLWAGYLQVRHQREMSALRGRLSGLVLQLINGISKFRVSATEGRAFSLWARQFSQQKTHSQRARSVANHLTVFVGVFPIFCSIAIFYWSARLMQDPAAKPLTTGEFLAFNAAFAQFLSAALQMSSSVISILSIVPLYERARPILETLPEVEEAKADPGDLSGAIESAIWNSVIGPMRR